MATIVWDARAERLHRPRPRARPVRCTGARATTARCRARNRRLIGVGVGVAMAGALALALVPGGDGPAPTGPTSPVAPMQPVSVSPSGADPVVGGTYRAIDRALAGSGDVSGLVAGLEGAAEE
jgi:hypothetical protein